MDESPPSPDWQWVNVTTASAILGLSPATIRRRIRDGATITVPGYPAMVLEAEREERPQGSVFLVRLPGGLRLPAEEASPPAPDASVEPAEEPSATNPDASSASDDDARIGNAIAAAVGPWVVQSARLNDMLLELSERIGTVQAQLRATEAERERLALRIAELERPRAEPASRWRAWLGALVSR